MAENNLSANIFQSRTAAVANKNLGIKLNNITGSLGRLSMEQVGDGNKSYEWAFRQLPTIPELPEEDDSAISRLSDGSVTKILSYLNVESLQTAAVVDRRFNRLSTQLLKNCKQQTNNSGSNGDSEMVSVDAANYNREVKPHYNNIASWSNSMSLNNMNNSEDV